jgi:arginyl-tRNA synthetase
VPAPIHPPVRALVRRAIERAWERAVASGALPAPPARGSLSTLPASGSLSALAAGDEAPTIEVERPSNPDHGDLATNLAMRLARPYRRAPLEIARALAAELERDAEAGGADEARDARPEAGGADEARDARPEAAAADAATLVLGSPIGSVEVAPPGFINIRLAPAFVEAAVDAARAAGPDFGRVAAPRPLHVNVEFVSANPTGPLHIGNARGAFVGDLLCRVLEAAGHRVAREYYFNDFGQQVKNLGASVVAIRLGTAIPEDGYHGDYVRDLAGALPAAIWERATTPGADRDAIVGTWASERVREGIEASLENLGVRFDTWKSEGSLFTDGSVERAVERLRAAGELYEQDGALWFRSTDHGDDKDRVIRKSSGDYTYFGSDIGYVAEKFGRGFDHLIYIWGADHHGTVARLKNAAEAMGYDRAAVEVILMAWVRFVRDGVEVSMSKRAGEFITLDDLLAEVGVDAARWFFGSRGHTSGIDFDIELAKTQSNENPVYYVQYAHARIASILRRAADTGLTAAGSLDGTLSVDEVSRGLAIQLLRLPEVVEDAAHAHETQGVTAYATDLATAFHAYYRDRRVVDPDDPATSAARLALVEATRLGLANALALLGISAPESM